MRMRVRRVGHRPAQGSALHMERVSKSIDGRRRMLLQLLAHNPESLPPHIDVKKLEEAYRRLGDYVLVFKKIEKGGRLLAHRRGLMLEGGPKD